MYSAPRRAGVTKTDKTGTPRRDGMICSKSKTSSRMRMGSCPTRTMSSHGMYLIAFTCELQIYEMGL